MTESSSPTIDELARRLTTTQKDLFDLVWNHHVETGLAYSTKSLQPRLGKTRITQILSGLSGSLIFEINESGAQGYRLTMLGALLTGHGNMLFGLLVRLFELVKKSYEANPEVTQVDSKLLNLSTDDSRRLFRLLLLTPPRTMPFYACGVVESWTVSITDDVTELFHADDVPAYCRSLLLTRFDPNEPVDHNTRLQHLISSNLPPSVPPIFPSGPSGVEVAQSSPPSGAGAPYVNPDRLQELQEIKSAKFDCSRLVAMCTELSECASRKNAHAVIMLLRAILDHVPPIFGLRSFAEVASNYSGGRSFKKAMGHLEMFSRNIADHYLHSQIQRAESLPNMTQVGFQQALDLLLAEIARILRK